MSAENHIDFNVNETVLVRLTDLGLQIHRTEHAEFCKRFGKDFPYNPPKEDADGWSEWQLWSLMAAFGQHMHLGSKLPFETSIRLRREA